MLYFAKQVVSNKIDSIDFVSINNSFGEDGIPEWIEIFSILKNIKL
jgi:hypothetical protein